MKVLPNGQIQIKNLLSGAEKIINPDEITKYGLSMDDYNTAKAQTQSTIFKPSGNYQQDIVTYGAEPAVRSQIDAYYNPPKPTTTTNFSINSPTKTTLNVRPPLSGGIIEDKKTTTSITEPLPAIDINSWAQKEAQRIRESDMSIEDQNKYLESISKEVSLYPQKSESEKTKESATKEVGRILDQLEDLYFGKGYVQDQYKGNSLSYGRLEGMTQSMGAATGFNSQLKRYEGLKASIRPKFVKAMGDSGNLSETEQQAAVKGMPNAFSTPEEAIGYFNDLRLKFGLQPKPIQKDESKEGVPFMGNAVRVTQDLGAAIKSKMNQPELEKSEALATELEKKAMTIKDTALRQKLVNNAQLIRDSVRKETDSLTSGYSRDVGQNNIWRGLKAGAEIATTAEMAAGLPKIVTGAKNILTGKQTIGKTLPKIGEIINPAKTGKELREGAIKVSNKPINGNKIISSMKEWKDIAIKGNPGKEKTINAIFNSVKNTYKNTKVSAQEAFKIWNEVDSGFTQGGITKTSVEASSDLAMRNTLRKLLDEVAPGFEKGTKLIKTGIDRQKFFKKLIWPAAIGTGISVGTAYGVNKALGQSRE